MGLLGLLTAPFKRGPRRPLSQRRPERHDAGDVPLGMEALDMGIVNAANRQNDALERVTTPFMRHNHHGSTRDAASKIAAMPEDETYAAVYHRAFIKKEAKS